MKEKKKNRTLRKLEVIKRKTKEKKKQGRGFYFIFQSFEHKANGKPREKVEIGENFNGRLRELELIIEKKNLIWKEA